MTSEKKLYHVGKNGPAPCNATKRACRYGAHFPTMNEAEVAFEKSMESEVDVLTSQSKKSGRKRSASLQKIDDLLSKLEAPYELEEISRIGELIAKDIEARAGIAFGKDDYSQEERNALSQAVSESLKELQGSEVPFTAKTLGKFAKNLEEAIEVFPSGANSLVTGDIHTKSIRRDSQMQAGFHIAQAEVYGNIEETMRVSSMIKNVEVGDFIFEDGFAKVSDFEDSGLIGASVSKMTRPAGSLQAGESYMPFLSKIYRSEDKFIELLNAGVLDGSGCLVEGREEDFKTMAPQFDEVVSTYALTENYYVGKKPKSMRTKKIADSVDIKGNDGEVSRANQTLWITEDKKIDYRAHTIALQMDHGRPPVASIAAHEFVHAIQSQPGGIPGEKEIFQKIYPTGNLIDEGRYKYYDSFPDDYMGHTGGKELFTRASEGLFYSTQADLKSYMYTDVNNGKEMRTWALGAWAILAKRGADKYKAK